MPMRVLKEHKYQASGKESVIAIRCIFFVIARQVPLVVDILENQ